MTVEYFRSRSPPNPHHTSAKAESWVASLAWYVTRLSIYTSTSTSTCMYV